MRTVEITAVSLITAEYVRVVLGKHVTTATPGLIAYTYILHVPGLLATVLLAQLGHGAVGSIHILNPLGGLLYGTAAHIEGYIRFASYKLAQVQELMCAETVVLHYSSPVVVHHNGTVLLGTYSVHPVILIGIAASGPAHDRHLKVLEGVQHIITVTFSIRHR